MTAEEFSIARQTLGETDDQLAAALGVTPHIIRAWAHGTTRIPSRHAKHHHVPRRSEKRELALK